MGSNKDDCMNVHFIPFFVAAYKLTGWLTGSFSLKEFCIATIYRTATCVNKIEDFIFTT